MIHDILAVFGLAKDLRKLLRRTPDGVGFSIVSYGVGGQADPRDHLRFVNLTPLTIHGFRFSIQAGEHGESVPVTRVQHPAPADVFGRPTVYTLEVPGYGIYMRPGAVFYVPMVDLKLPQLNGDLRVAFTYTAANGKRLPGNLQHVVRVHAVNSDPHVAPPNKAMQPSGAPSGAGV